MSLIKTSFFSALITIIRISSGFVSNKVVAIFAGAPGVALVGAFTNFLSIVLTFANGAINTGVVKYTAQHDGDEIQLKNIFSTSLKITVYCSVLVGVLLLVFASYWSHWIFTDIMYTGPIRVLGISIVFYAVNSLLISILNGKNQIKTYTLVNTLGSIIGLICTVLLVYFYKVQGALYALVLSQTIVFFITVVLLVKSSWFSWSFFNQKFDKSIAVKLSHYSLMAIVSAMTVPVSQIILRNHIIDTFGIHQAGYWQGMMRISDAYLMLITTSLSTYFLPKLSSIKNNDELRKEIFSGYKLIMPLVLLGCLGIYFFRFILIKMLFTSEFIAMESLFYWQLVGDFFKMAAWILAYMMLARAMTKMYIITEIVFSLLYVVMGYVFTDLFQLKGMVLAFAVNYFLYFIFMVLLFRKLLFNKSE